MLKRALAAHRRCQAKRNWPPVAKEARAAIVGGTLDLIEQPGDALALALGPCGHFLHGHAAVRASRASKVKRSCNRAGRASMNCTTMRTAWLLIASGVARAPLRGDERLRDKIAAQLAAIKRMPQLVRSFFQAPTVAYITDW